MTQTSTAFRGKRAYEHLEHLSVTIGPRLTGSAGEHRAARYIAKHFKACGLTVRQQRFPCVTYSNRTCRFEVKDGRRWREIEAEPVMLSKSTPASGVEGEIYFAHSGQLEYLTPAMKDKIVLVAGRIRAEDRRRVLDYAPKAVVRIEPRVETSLRRAVLHDADRKTYGSLPMAAIGHLDGLEIVKRCQKRLTRARLVLRNTEKPSHSLNVIGELAGTQFPDEIVVICAHYDSHWRIPGAADNAGGTAVLLELARVLAQRPSKRTLRFIAFAAEETGLYGSSYYAEQLARADRRAKKRASFDEKVDRTECDRHWLTFNLDVHGAALGRFVATYTGCDDLGASVRLLAKEVGMACSVEKKPMSSDGTPLAAVGIPNVQFARYGAGFGHKVDDDIRYLSADALATAGDFAERYLRRYVTDAPTQAFPRDIPDDQAKAVTQYFTNRKFTIPGQEPKTKPRRTRKK